MIRKLLTRCGGVASLVLLVVGLASGAAASSITRAAPLVVSGSLSVLGSVTMTQSLLFTDNVGDVGASGATRPRNVFVAGNVHGAGWMHAQVGFTYGVHVVTIANDANAGTANAEVLAGSRSLYALDCNDPQGCTMTIGESSVTAGQMLTVVNISTSGYNATFADSGNNHLAGALTLTPDDVVTFVYMVNRGGDGNWYEVARSAN